jgi:hypothetical protein
VTGTFGPNTQPVLAFLARLSDLSPKEIGEVTNAWRDTSDRDRADAWVQVHRAVTERERYQILAAASVARRAALFAASRHRWPDWVFSAAASDAAAAIAAGDRIGSHYDTLISPLAAVMPWLSPAQGEVQTGEDVLDSHRASGGFLRQGA